MSSSNMVKHAQTELQLLGEDPETIAGMLKVIQAFADMGHSGGSASICIPMLNELLHFRNLTPLTNDPREWMDVADYTPDVEGVWQSRRRPDAFSNDGGLTHYLLDDLLPKRPWRRSYRSRRRIIITHDART
jgi:hypothetical protein